MREENIGEKPKMPICLIEWLFSASAIPEISFAKKVARSSVMQADRLRAAKTLSSCF